MLPSSPGVTCFAGRVSRTVTRSDISRSSVTRSGHPHNAIIPTPTTAGRAATSRMRKALAEDDPTEHDGDDRLRVDHRGGDARGQRRERDRGQGAHRARRGHRQRGTSARHGASRSADSGSRSGATRARRPRAVAAPTASPGSRAPEAPPASRGRRPRNTPRSLTRAGPAVSGPHSRSGRAGPRLVVRDVHGRRGDDDPGHLHRRENLAEQQHLHRQHEHRDDLVDRSHVRDVAVLDRPEKNSTNAAAVAVAVPATTATAGGPRRPPPGDSPPRPVDSGSVVATVTGGGTTRSPRR